MFAAWKTFLAEGLDSWCWLITVNHVVDSSKMLAWCSDSASTDFSYFPVILYFIPSLVVVYTLELSSVWIFNAEGTTILTSWGINVSKCSFKKKGFKDQCL